MVSLRIVIDTNVLVAALRSKRGASYQLLMRLGSGKYEPAVSVPLVLEYESVAKRLIGHGLMTGQDIDEIIDYICSVSIHGKIHYLWRPFLRDHKDDMLLELAVATHCSHIVTFNVKDFVGSEQFGLKILTPQAFLAELGA